MTPLYYNVTYVAAGGILDAFIDILSGMEDRGWQSRANCMGVDPDLFFPERGASTREAKEVCRRLRRARGLPGICPGQWREVRIWGGMSERERRRPASARAIERDGPRLAITRVITISFHAIRDSMVSSGAIPSSSHRNRSSLPLSAHRDSAADNRPPVHLSTRPSPLSMLRTRS